MMISPRLSLVTPASSAVLVAPLVRARRARGTVSSHKESIKPEMTPKSGQNARCGVVALAAAASGDGNNNNNANENPPSTSTSNASSAAAAAAAIATAASAAVDEFIRSGDVVAVGPGELPAAVLCELARRLESGSLEKIRVVAAGDAPAAEAAVAGVPQVQQSEGATTPDVAILQADEVDRGDLSFIACRHDDGLLGTSSSSSSSSSGRGGSLPQPHLARVAAVASAARRGTVALAASPLSLVERLTGDVPVAVELEEMPDGSGRDWEEAAEELDDEFLGDAALGVWRRPSASGLPRTHPRGGDNPHAEVTVEGGTTLLDVRFGEGGPLTLLGDARAAYEDVLATIEGVDGVVGCGLFCRGVAGVVVVAGGDDGKSPRVMRRPT